MPKISTMANNSHSMPGVFFLFILNLNNNPSDETNTKCEQGRKIAENNHNHKINRNRTNKIQQQYYESSG